jgi:hypothetical protein
MTLIDLIKLGITSFRSDPPDSEFQQGYLEALKEMERFYERNEMKTCLEDSDAGTLIGAFK